MNQKITKKKIDNVVCESCGEKFFCGANTKKCWCFEVDLQSETLEDLRENFSKCLCQNCLLKTAENRKAA